MQYNTGETTESLKNEYNPDGSVLRKCQLRLFDMLCYFDEICKKLNIEYRLDSGSVLGAVRHEGFIPWDDDLDVVISKKDEKKLCDYLISNPNSQYVLLCPQTDSSYHPENLLDFVTILQEELVRAKVLPADYDFEAHKEQAIWLKNELLRVPFDACLAKC